MAGRNVPVVLVPRYTTYLGNQGFPTQPIPVAAYSKITIDFWHGPIQGAGPPGVGISFTESNDLENWVGCTGGPWFVPSGVGELQFSADLTRAWFQFLVVPTGGNPGVTCWAQGFFELREK